MDSSPFEVVVAPIGTVGWLRSSGYGFPVMDVGRFAWMSSCGSTVFSVAAAIVELGGVLVGIVVLSGG